MPPCVNQAGEAAPLLATPTTEKARARHCHGAVPRPPPSPPPLGTARFPFHPRARATPRWRKLLLSFFDGHRHVSPLEDDDVWPLEPALRATQAASDVQRALPAHGRGRLLRAMRAANRRRLLWMSARNAVAVALGLVRPLLLLQLCHAEFSKTADAGIVGPVAGIFAAELALALASAHSHHNAFRVSLHVSQSLSKMIMNKMLVSTVELAAPDADAAGYKEQFVRTTSMRFGDVQTIFHFVILARRQCFTLARLAVSVAVLLRIVDISWAVAGAAVALYAVALVVQATLGQWLSFQVSTLHVGWLKTLYDTLKSIQMAKLSAWEAKLQSKIERLRSKERRATIRFLAFWLFRYRLLMETPLLWAALTFESETAWLSPARVFSALVLFCDCRLYSANIVPALHVVLAGVHAWRRVEAFVATESENLVAPTTPYTFSRSATQSTRHHITKMEGACITPASRTVSSPALLLDVHWTLRQGDLVIVHGAAGVGKSTLLAALRGDHTAARLVLGSIDGVPRDCRIAYCSQDPWLQTLSIRDNILFGTAYDSHKYWAVIDSCGLLEDLATLPAGDATAVGPRGINLSSGQMARIALARACYADADLYLLDCPLANVDAVVQSEIFRKCIVELLMFKTVVIVTHNPEYIGSSYVDQLVEVKPFTVIVTCRSGSKSETKSTTSSEKCRVTRRTRDYQHEPSWKSNQHVSLKLHSLSRESQERRSQIELVTSAASTKLLQQQPHGEHSTADVSWATVNEFLLGGGKASLLWLFGAVLMYTLWIITSITKDVWLLQWATTPGSRALDYQLATRYGGLVLVSIVFAVVAALCVFAFSAASVDRLFQRTTHALLHATMTFYYQTRPGEIINRFERDMEAAHKALPLNLDLLALSVATFLGRAAVYAWVLGPIGLFVTVLGYVLVVRCIALRFYQQLMRSTTQAHADQLSFLSEALDGGAVLRAFGNERVARLVGDLERVHERLFQVKYMLDVFGSHTILRAKGATTLLACSLFGVLMLYPVTPMEFMLVLFYLLTMSETLVPRFAIGLENTWDAFDNVERLRQFRDMPAELDSAVADLPADLGGSWQPSGQVIFESVSFTYLQPFHDNSTTLALRDVSFSIRGGEKIGVIGRTGSGKSSLAMALLRVHPLRSGRILLNGVDLRTVPLSQLRRSVTMIPQSPTFYRCSIRDYLDPFHEFDDAQLWRELLTVDLGARVQSLDEELLDNGENWSLGQRQLLCFARALLKPSRVVVLDEAFSCVDQSCQKKILRILRERFASSTVILITHRLDQILEFDRILVMCGGRLVESGSAPELASDASSLFYEFLETSLLTF